MFTATTFYQICIGVLGAVSVRGDCWKTPDENGLVVIPEGTDTIPANVSTNELLPPLNIFSISDRNLHSNRLPLHRHFMIVKHYRKLIFQLA